MKNKKANSHFDLINSKHKTFVKSKRSNSHFDFLFINKNLLKSKRSQTNTLKLALLIGGIFIALIIIYNVAKPFSIKGKTPDFWSKEGELATVKKTGLDEYECDSNENCDDKNDCTDDFCKNKICEYTNKTEGVSCSIGEAGGACKNGKCVSG